MPNADLRALDSALVAVARKVENDVRGDVPTGIAVSMVALLVVLFVPLVHRVRAYPTDLPPLAWDPTAVERVHRADRDLHLVSAAPEVLATWSVLASAQAAQDTARAVEAQQRFAEVLAEGTQGDRAAMLRLRAAARRVFLRDLDVPRMPLTVIARRHGLTGPDVPPGVGVSVGTLIAWFDFRWERLSLPTPERGELEPTEDTLQRIPAPERRALVAWGLDARCPGLTGHDDYPRPGDPMRCARLRRESVEAARSLDRAYPLDEALAAVDVMEALAEEDVADAAEDTGLRSGALASAQAALVRAQERYGAILRARRSRRIERYLMGVVAELGRTEP